MENEGVTGLSKLPSIPVTSRLGDGRRGASRYCTISSDGTIAVVAYDDYSASVWDIVDGNVLCTYQGHRAMINACALSRKADIAATADMTGRVEVWSAFEGETLCVVSATQDERMSATACAIAADGRTIVACFASHGRREAKSSVRKTTNSEASAEEVCGEVVIVGLNTGAVKSQWHKPSEQPQGCQVSGDGEVVAVCTSTGPNQHVVHLYKVRSASVLQTWSCAPSTHAPAISMDDSGRVLAIADSTSVRICTASWSNVDKTVAECLSLNGGRPHCSLSPTGFALVAKVTFAQYALVDARQHAIGAWYARLADGEVQIHECGISQTGDVVVAGAEDGLLRVFQTASVLPSMARMKGSRAVSNLLRLDASG